MGGTGNDRLEGGAGTDELVSGGGEDVLLGEADYDWLEAIDNADTDYSEDGGAQWKSSQIAGGFNGGQRFAEGEATAGEVVTAGWKFNNLPAGEYDVYVTWQTDPRDLAQPAIGASNAQFSVNPDGTAINVAAVDQQTQPSDLAEDGLRWQHLANPNVQTGRFVRNGSDPLIITLTNANADGRVYADAVRVVRYNAAPEVTVGPNDVLTVDELTALEVTFTADDPDDTLTGENFELVTPWLDKELLDTSSQSGSATFTWPATDRPTGTFAITVRVTDNGAPAQSTLKTVLVTVGDVGTEPAFTAPTTTEYSATVGTSRTFDATATGSNIAYSLSPNAPLGASIDASGHFAWTPTSDQAATEPYTFDIRATDDGGSTQRAVMPISVTVHRELGIEGSLVLVHDTDDGAEGSLTNGITADPTITGIVTSDGGFDFVEVVIDYNFYDAENEEFQEDDIVSVEPIQGEVGRARFVATPRPSQLHAIDGSDILNQFAVKVRRWDPDANSGAGAYIESTNTALISVNPDVDAIEAPDVSIGLKKDTSGSDDESTDPTLEGQVTNDGLVDGLTVNLFYRETAATGEPAPLGSTTTDADGWFEFVPDIAVLNTLRNGAASVGVDVWAIALGRNPLMLPSDEATPSGDFNEGPFQFTYVVNEAPVIASLALKSDTGDADDDRITSDPTIVGTIDDDYHSAGSIRIEFFLDNDNENGILDGEEVIQGVAIPVETETPGTLSFVYLPTDIIGVSDARIAARVVEWDPYTKQFLASDLSDPNAANVLTFTYDEGESTVASLESFDLKNHLEGHAIIDPTVSGTVSLPGVEHAADVTVQFSVVAHGAGRTGPAGSGHRLRLRHQRRGGQF